MITVPEPQRASTIAEDESTTSDRHLLPRLPTEIFEVEVEKDEVASATPELVPTLVGQRPTIRQRDEPLDATTPTHTHDRSAPSLPTASFEVEVDLLTPFEVEVDLRGHHDQSSATLTERQPTTSQRAEPPPLPPSARLTEVDDVVV